MSLLIYLQVFCEFYEPALALVEQEFTQFNLFEKADTLCLSFNGFTLLRLYKRHVEQLYLKFKGELDDGIAKRSLPAEIIHLLDELKLGLKELERKYYKERLKDKEILLHDMLCLNVCLDEHQEVCVKLKVSEFLSAQKSILRLVKELIDLRIKQTQYKHCWSMGHPNPKNGAEIPFESPHAASPDDLLWDGNDTDLVELSTSLLECKYVRKREGKLTKKHLLAVFEGLFHIKIENPDVLLSKTLTRKTESAPFLSKLKEGFERYIERKVNK